MPTFVKLPSGLLVNPALIRRVVEESDGERGRLAIYFDDQDFARLDVSDSDALRKYLRRTSRGAAPSAYALRVSVFWIVIVAAVLLVWIAVRR